MTDLMMDRTRQQFLNNFQQGVLSPNDGDIDFNHFKNSVYGVVSPPPPTTPSMTTPGLTTPLGQNPRFQGGVGVGGGGVQSLLRNSGSLVGGGGVQGPTSWVDQAIGFLNSWVSVLLLLALVAYSLPQRDVA